MTQAEKIRYLQLVNHLLFAVGIYYAVYSIWTSVVIGLAFGVIGINIGFHRYLSHRSFETHPIFDKIILYVGTICLVGTPLTWTISHINHHAYADAEGDPYSPHRLSIWNFLMTRFEAVQHPMLGAKAVIKNKTAMWLHQNYFKAIGAYCAVLFLIDPWLVVYAWAMPSLIALYVLLITNIVCHLYGYQNYKTENHSSNNVLVSLLTFGEGWHNNHHNNPSRWSQGDRWWELDPTSWIIRLIKK